MGLMTNPKAQEFISKFVLKVYKPFCLLLYLGAFVAIVVISSHPFSAKTYISENALLPGLVDRSYKKTSDIAGYAEELNQLQLSNEDIPQVWLQQKFQEIGLDTFYQNFSVSHPFQESVDKVSGTNIFAILRAPRIASTEAVVFSVPYRQGRDANELGATNFGIGLMFSLAKHFIQQTYWSKDIIFLIVDKENVGAEAWLESYHDTRSDCIAKSQLHGRSGAIMAAVNLELPSKSVDQFDLRIEGLNGQLPNLDLFNLAVRLCEKEGISPTFHGDDGNTRSHRHPIYEVQQTSKTMLSNMFRQASGKPFGIHGLFLRYGIQALTLHAEPGRGNRPGNQIHSVGYVVEGIFRSINNILERFHQSFFFYVLPHTKKYVSIGLYMIPMGMLLVIPTLQGLALWFSLGEKNKDGDNNIESGIQHQYAVSSFIAAHVCGILLYLSPEFLVGIISPYSGLPPKEALLVGLIVVYFGVILLPLSSREREESLPAATKKTRWMTLKCYALVWQAITLLALSMINFSLAFLVGIFTIPVCGICKPVSYRLLSLINKLLLLLVSPPFLLCLLLCIHKSIFYGWTLSASSLLETSSQALWYIPHAVIDQYLFNNWTFATVSLVLFPSWQLFWICSSL